MAMLSILVALGFLAGKTKILNADGTKLLSKIIINITLPCSILASVLGDNKVLMIGDTVFFLLLSFLSFFIYLTIAFPIMRALGGEKRSRGLYCYMAAFSNFLFMGLPLTSAIFGEASAVLVAIYNIPFSVLTFTIGVYMISGKRAKFEPKVLINPPTIAAFLAVAIITINVEAPAFIADTLSIAGGMTTPGAMLVVGGTMALAPFRDMFSKWRLYPVTALKLIIMPVVIWLIFRQFNISELMLGVLVVISAMPVAATSTMFAIEFGGDEQLTSAGVAMTTLLSLITIPLIVYLLLL